MRERSFCHRGGNDGFFYFDRILSVFEKFFQWDQALVYLENLYSKDKAISILNSLVGYSWYYLVEGPITSRMYENDPNVMALEVWKKYIDIGSCVAHNNPFFNFIAGYTLCMHGFLINDCYERKGPVYMKKCLDSSDNVMLQQLAKNFLDNEKSSQYTPVKEGKTICAQLFNGESLLDEYFREFYNGN